MDIYELRKQALDREQHRALRLADAMAGLPKRKTGETVLICKLAEQAHKTLCAYDLMPVAPALAGITETWFEAALERIANIKAEAAAAAFAD
jgi:hypothetical protein